MTPPADTVPFAKAEIVPAAQDAALEVLRSGWVTTGPRSAAFEQALAQVPGRRACGLGRVLYRGDRAGAAGAAAPVPVPSCSLRPDLLRRRRSRSSQPTCVRSWSTWTRIPSSRRRPRWRTPSAVRAGARPWSSSTWPVFPPTSRRRPPLRACPSARAIQDAAHGLGRRPSRGPRWEGAVQRGPPQLLRDEEPPGRRGRRDGHRLRRTRRLTRVRPGCTASAATPGAATCRTDPGGTPWTSLASRRISPTSRRRSAWPSCAICRAGRPVGRSSPPATTRRWRASTGLGLRRGRPSGWHAWHLYQVRVTAACGISRDAMIAALTEPRYRHLRPLHPRAPPPAVQPDPRPGGMPFRAGHRPMAQELLSLPMYPALDDADVVRVAEALREAPVTWCRNPQSTSNKGGSDAELSGLAVAQRRGLLNTLVRSGRGRPHFGPRTCGATPATGLVPIAFLDDAPGFAALSGCRCSGPSRHCPRCACADGRRLRGRHSVAAGPRVAGDHRTRRGPPVHVRFLPSFVAALVRDARLADLRHLKVAELLGRRATRRGRAGAP